MKEIAKVVSLFLVLILIALSPIFVMERQNNQLIQKVNTESFTAEEIAFQNTNDTYNSIERIKIIQNSVQKKTGITTLNEQKMTADEQRVILSRADEAIKSLQDAGFIPTFEVVNTKEFYSIQKNTFSDSKELDKGVSIYTIEIDYANDEVYLWLDEQTSKIYSISIFSEQENNEFFQTDFNVKDYISYLEIDDSQLICKLHGDGLFGDFYSEQYDVNWSVYYYKEKESGFIEFGIQFYK